MDARSECHNHSQMAEQSSVLRFKLSDFHKSGNCEVDNATRATPDKMVFLDDHTVVFRENPSEWDVYALGITVYDCVSGFSLICDVGRALALNEE